MNAPLGARTRRTLFAIAAVVPLLTFCALGWGFIRANSQTSDEAAHLAAGYSYLATGDFRLNPEHPPLIKMLAALPLRLRYGFPWAPDSTLWANGGEMPLGSAFLYRSPIPADTLLTVGRLPNLVLGVLLVALVGWWSYRLWGRGAALLGLTLAALEPNLIAHASLVTTDTGLALFMLLAVYLYWEYARSPRVWLLVATGVATGLALSSKFSSIVLIGILALLAGNEIVARGVSRRAARGLVPLALVYAVAAAVVAATYFFHNTSIWWLGFVDVVLHQGSGHSAYFLGEYSPDGWWDYFFVAFLIKTPIGSILLVAASLIPWRNAARPGRRETIFLLIVPVVVLTVATRARIDIGLRHILPIYPFLYVFASRLATLRFRSPAILAAAIGLPVAMTTVSSLRIAPHQLAYFNEAIGGPRNGPDYLSDSNIDWGQDLKGLRGYVEREHPDAIYVSYFGNAPFEAFGFPFQYAPAFGTLEPPSAVPMVSAGPRELFAISVLNLQGVFFSDHTLYSWLSRRTPVATIGYSIYVYDITRDAEAHVQLAKAYLRAGPAPLARPELTKALIIDPGNVEAAALLRALGRTG